MFVDQHLYCIAIRFALYGPRLHVFLVLGDFLIACKGPFQRNCGCEERLQSKIICLWKVVEFVVVASSTTDSEP